MKKMIKLTNPITINGKSRNSFEYDENEITVEQFTLADAKAHSVAITKGQTFSVMEVDASLHTFIGMYAIIAVNPDVDISDLERVKGSDIISITRIGRNFTSTQSEESSAENSSDEDLENTLESSTPQ